MPFRQNDPATIQMLVLVSVTSERADVTMGRDFLFLANDSVGEQGRYVSRGFAMSEHWRTDFIGFLERLIAVKGRIRAVDWDRFIITHYLVEEVEEMRRTIVRLQHSWAYRDWPEVNLELVASWVKKLRQSVVA
jgi:hypothetical protein